MTKIIIFPAAGLLITLFFGRGKKTKRKEDSIPFYISALNRLIEGNIPEALKDLRETVKRDTENIDAYIKLGDIFREKGWIEKAIKVHRDLTVRTNLKPDQRLGIMKSLALDYEAAKDYDKSLAMVDEILKLDKNNPWAKQMQLKLYEVKGEWTKAFELLQKISKKRDKKRLALYKVEEGLKLIKEGKEKEGRIRFRQALKWDSSCPPAYLYLGDSYMREGREERALKVWRGFIERVPYLSYLAFERLREVLFDIGSFNEMEDIYQSILQRDPGNTDAMFALVNIYDSKGEMEKAIDYCHQILEKDPNSIKAKQYLIKLHYKKGAKEEALREAMKLIDEVWTEKKDFVCKKCGFSSKDPLWHCPQCGEWNSFLND